MDFSLVIDELGRRSGLDALSLDDQGCCSVLFNGEHEVEFQLDRETGAVLYWCIVGSLGDMTESLGRLLLEKSALGAGTAGAAFGIYEPLDAIILWARQPGGFADLEDCMSAVGAFLGQCTFWKAAIRNHAMQEPAQAIPPGMPFPMV